MASKRKRNTDQEQAQSSKSGYTGNQARSDLNDNRRRSKRQNSQSEADFSSISTEGTTRSGKKKCSSTSSLTRSSRRSSKSDNSSHTSRFTSLQSAGESDDQTTTGAFQSKRRRRGAPVNQNQTTEHHQASTSRATEQSTSNRSRLRSCRSRNRPVMNNDANSQGYDLPSSGVVLRSSSLRQPASILNPSGHHSVSGAETGMALIQPSQYVQMYTAPMGHQLAVASTTPQLFAPGSSRASTTAVAPTPIIANYASRPTLIPSQAASMSAFTTAGGMDPTMQFLEQVPTGSNANRFGLSISSMMTNLSSVLMNVGHGAAGNQPPITVGNNPMMGKPHRSSHRNNPLMIQSMIADPGLSQSQQPIDSVTMAAIQRQQQQHLTSGGNILVQPPRHMPPSSTVIAAAAGNGLTSLFLDTSSLRASQPAHHRIWDGAAAAASSPRNIFTSAVVAGTSSNNELSNSVNFRIAQLRQSLVDRNLQLTIIQEINQSLLMGFEENLASMNVQGLVEAITEILECPDEHLVELKNLSCNVLTHMMDTLPRSSDMVIPCIPLLLRTMTDSYVGDLLERVINVLEQLSRVHGHAVLKSGAIAKVLQFYDFVTMAQHRTILSMVCNCFTNLRVTDFELVVNCLPALVDRLKEPEPKCVERVCTAYSRLVQSYVTQPHLLKVIATETFLANVQHLLIASPPVVSSVLEIVQLLAILCTTCPDLAVDLIKQNIAATVCCLLTGYNFESLVGHGFQAAAALQEANSSPVTEQNQQELTSSMQSRSQEEINGIIDLIAELLPPLPQSPNYCLQTLLNHVPSGKPSRGNRRSTNNKTGKEETHIWSYRMLLPFGNTSHEPIGDWSLFGVQASDLLERLHRECLDKRETSGSSRMEAIISLPSQIPNNPSSTERYYVDFQSMIETNVVTGIRRQLRRQSIDNSSQPVPDNGSCSNAKPLQHQRSDKYPKRQQAAATDARTLLLIEECTRYDALAQQHQLTETPADGQQGEDTIRTTRSSSNKVAVTPVDMEFHALRMVQILLPLLFDLYTECGNLVARLKCLSAINRMLYHTVPSVIARVLRPKTVSSQVGAILLSGEPRIVLGGLQLAKLLIDRVPHLFCLYFRKEGVYHRIGRFITEATMIQQLVSQLPLNRSMQTVAPASPFLPVALNESGGSTLRSTRRKNKNKDVEQPTVTAVQVLTESGSEPIPPPEVMVIPSNTDTVILDVPVEPVTVKNVNTREQFLADWIFTTCTQLHEVISKNLDMLSGVPETAPPVMLTSPFLLENSPAFLQQNSNVDLVPILQEMSTQMLSHEEIFWTQALETLVNLFAGDLRTTTDLPGASSQSMMCFFESPSAFELQQSGLIGSFLRYLTDPSERKKRLRMILRAFMGKRVLSGNVLSLRLLTHNLGELDKLNEPLSHSLMWLLPKTGSSGASATTTVACEDENVGPVYYGITNWLDPAQENEEDYAGGANQQDHEEDPDHQIFLHSHCSNQKALSSLVQCLLQALNQLEQFPVHGSPSLVLHSAYGQREPMTAPPMMMKWDPQLLRLGLHDMHGGLSTLQAGQKPTKFVSPIVGTVRLELIQISCPNTGLEDEVSDARKCSSSGGNKKHGTSTSPLIVRITALTTIQQLERVVRQRLASGGGHHRSEAPFWLLDSSTSGSSRPPPSDDSGASSSGRFTSFFHMPPPPPQQQQTHHVLSAPQQQQQQTSSINPASSHHISSRGQPRTNNMASTTISTSSSSSSSTGAIQRGLRSLLHRKSSTTSDHQQAGQSGAGMQSQQRRPVSSIIESSSHHSSVPGEHSTTASLISEETAVVATTRASSRRQKGGSILAAFMRPAEPGQDAMTTLNEEQAASMAVSGRSQRMRPSTAALASSFTRSAGNNRQSTNEPSTSSGGGLVGKLRLSKQSDDKKMSIYGSRPSQGKKQRNSGASNKSSASTHVSCSKMFEKPSGSGGSSSYDAKMVPIFYINGHRMHPDWTLYQVIRRYCPTLGSILATSVCTTLNPEQSKEDLVNQFIWGTMHALQYQMVTPEHYMQLLKDDTMLAEKARKPEMDSVKATFTQAINCLKRTRNQTPPMPQQLQLQPTSADLLSAEVSKNLTVGSSCSTISSASSCGAFGMLEEANIMDEDSTSTSYQDIIPGTGETAKDDQLMAATSVPRSIPQALNVCTPANSGPLSSPASLMNSPTGGTGMDTITKSGVINTSDKHQASSGGGGFFESLRTGIRGSKIKPPGVNHAGSMPLSMLLTFINDGMELPGGLWKCIQGTNDPWLTETTVLPDTPVYGILVLLRHLHAINNHWYSLDGVIDSTTIISNHEFLSHKLTGKAARQLDDVFSLLASNIPPWLVQLISVCPFLFTFEVRQAFFFVYNFDRERLLLRVQDTIGAPEQNEGQNFAGGTFSNRGLLFAHQSSRGASSSSGSVPSSMQQTGMSASHVLQSALAGSQTALTGAMALSSNTAVSSLLIQHQTQHQALSALLGSSSSQGAGNGPPQLKRHKTTVDRSRKKLLRQAENMLAEVRDSRCILEIAFDGEVGFGIGPTLEFYTLVSRELMCAQLNLWHTDSKTDDGYCIAPQPGLFPRPIARNIRSSHFKEIRSKFFFLGRLMARALLDNRQLDLPLSPVFFKWFLASSNEHAQQCIGPADLISVDPQMAKQLNYLVGLAKERHQLIRRLDNMQSQVQVMAVEVRQTAGSLLAGGSPQPNAQAMMKAMRQDVTRVQANIKRLDSEVDDLCLMFSLPGYQIDLIKNGSNLAVVGANLAQYCSLMCNYFLLDGVFKQIQALVEGFDSVLPEARSRLRTLFLPEECEGLFCGGGMTSLTESWDMQTLMETCKCDHGYTSQSKAIRLLFELMTEFTPEERRLFVQFVTGSPRLPVGGFRALKPPLKIVMKHEANGDADSHLPSVMTCQNYLKLPDYSTKEAMRQKLLYAIREGQNAFHLS